MGSKGSLRDMNLTSLISVNCNEMRKARLRLVHNSQRAEIYFDHGDIVHMALGDQKGEQVIQELLTWEDGEYELEPGVVAPEVTVTSNWSGLLLHGLIQLDEQGHIQETFPPTTKEKDAMEQEFDISRRLTETLQALGRSTPGIIGSAVVSIDGFAIASQLPHGVEERKLGAMAAAMLGLGEQTVEEFDHKALERVFIEGEEGYTVITSAGKDAMLAVIAHKDAKLGLVFLQVGRASEEVKKVLAFQPEWALR